MNLAIMKFIDHCKIIIVINIKTLLIYTAVVSSLSVPTNLINPDCIRSWQSVFYTAGEKNPHKFSHSTDTV